MEEDGYCTQSGTRWQCKRGGNEPPTEEEIRYTFRKLACTRCGHQQETSWMQLRTHEGYRAVHCRNCGKQERSARNKCQCDVVWHQCSKHRVDPAEHKSRKAPKKTPQQKQQESEKQKDEQNKSRTSSKRKAPVIEEQESQAKGKPSRKARKESDFYQRQQATAPEMRNWVMLAMQQRIRDKEVQEAGCCDDNAGAPEVGHESCHVRWCKH